MKKAKGNGFWFNIRDKEVGGILLEGREAMLRRGGPMPDARAGLRWMGVWPEFHSTIL